MGRACRRMGIQVNFAPVLDVNSNPQNPVIGNRSFGENPDNVSRKARLYAQGLEDEGVMAVGKHFPGHGDTHEDSHHTLPSVLRDRAHLDTCELLPFTRYIRAGFSGLMVGHLLVPALDSTGSRPSSLSPRIVTSLLQEEMGFDGLIFTDALEMKGARSTSIALDALLAGNDILLKPLKPEAEFEQLLQSYQNGTLPQEIIDRHCRKVLQYKYILGLHTRPTVETDSLTEELNSPESRLLIRRRSTEALTTLHNRAEDSANNSGTYPGSTFGSGLSLFARYRSSAVRSLKLVSLKSIVNRSSTEERSSFATLLAASQNAFLA